MDIVPANAEVVMARSAETVKNFIAQERFWRISRGSEADAFSSKKFGFYSLN